MLRHRFTAALVLAVFAVSAGCASTVHIHSSPEGAQVFVDGDSIGYTPTSYTSTAVVFTPHFLELRMDGYEVYRTTLRRDSEINVAGVIGGFFCLIPWLWFLDYPSQVHYQLRPIQGELSPEGSSEEPLRVAGLGE